MMPLLGGVLEEDTLRLGFTGYMSMIPLSGGNGTLPPKLTWLKHTTPSTNTPYLEGCHDPGMGLTYS